MTIETDEKVVRYAVDLFADGSDIELMSKKELFEFAEEQTQEWYDENLFQCSDEQEKYKNALKLAKKIVTEKYSIKTLNEVKLLFSLPATNIPFEITYV